MEFSPVNMRAKRRPCVRVRGIQPGGIPGKSPPGGIDWTNIKWELGSYEKRLDFVIR